MLTDNAIDPRTEFREFVNGPIYWSSASGAHPVANHFFAAWQRKGWEAGFLRYPTTDEIPAANGGRRQEFQGGAIYWHFNEAYSIGGAIRDKWNTVGAEGGPLGYPNTDEISVTKNSGRYNNFENGTITWSGLTGARLLYGAIRDRWIQFGREDGQMGYPLGDERVAPDGTGHYSPFEGYGSIYWYPVIGAWPVPQSIFALWQTAGYEAGALGYPIAAPQTLTPSPGYLRQKFQKGFAVLANNGEAMIATTG